MSEEFNLQERVLCEDDTCIGLVGPDGKCKVCGRVYQGTEPLPSEDGALVDPFDSGAIAGPDDSDDEDVAAAEVTADEAEDNSSETETWDADERVLCSDDTCIGIIGPDGKCGTCGRPAG